MLEGKVLQVSTATLQSVEMTTAKVAPAKALQMAGISTSSGLVDGASGLVKDHATQGSESDGQAYLRCKARFGNW